MITTLDIKKRLYSGYFSIGNPNGTHVLIVGSCRTVPYLNYFNDLIANKLANYYVTFIDPHDFHWNADGEMQDIQDALLLAESDPKLMEIFRKTEVFIHEYHKNFGCFNSVSGGKTIYDYGLNAPVDIGVPNWHRKTLLAHDIVAFDPIASALMAQNLERGKSYIQATALKNLHEFRMDVLRSGVPGFLRAFDATFAKRRIFSNTSHILTEFSYLVWREILAIIQPGLADEQHFGRIRGLRMYEECQTPVCAWDVETLGLTWGVEVGAPPSCGTVTVSERGLSSEQVAL